MPEIVEKPLTRGRAVGQAWGVFGCALGGGFMLGAAMGGFAEERIIGVIIGAVLFPLAGAGFAIQIAPFFSGLSRAALFLTAYVGGLLVGLGGKEGADLRGSDQISAWFGSIFTKAGLVLLVVAVVIALVFTFRRTSDQKGAVPDVRA
ncbi:MAG: hypothetical protein WD757_07175 [Actinomycetota bacterium]